MKFKLMNTSGGPVVVETLDADVLPSVGDHVLLENRRRVKVLHRTWEFLVLGQGSAVIVLTVQDVEERDFVGDG